MQRMVEISASGEPLNIPPSSAPFRTPSRRTVPTHLELRQRLREAVDLVGDLLGGGLAGAVVELDAPVLVCRQAAAHSAVKRWQQGVAAAW